MILQHRFGLIAESLRLLRPFWPLAVMATGMGMLSGLATAWLLAKINQALQAEAAATAALLCGFAGLVAVMLAGEVASDLGNSFIGQEVIAALRRNLVTRIVEAPIDRIERFGVHRVLAVLGQDVDTVSAFSYGFSSLAIAAAVTTGCMAYLVALSPALFLFVAPAIGCGLLLNRATRKRGAIFYDQARSAQDELYRGYRIIAEGAKELRMQRGRRRHVHEDQIGATIGRIRDAKVHAFRIFMAANAADSALFFAVIGLILACRSWLDVEAGVASGFILVLLYVKGPLGQLLGAYATMVNAQISFRRIAALSAEFANPEPGLAAMGPGLEIAPAFASLHLRQVRYDFPGGDGKTAPFRIGPLDLDIRKGELVFIVGANGSGKTTLVKLLLGLYVPQQGEVLLNGVPVTDDTRDDYRQIFSTIFFDYFLFQDLPGRGPPKGVRISALLERLELAHKVRIEAGRLSTTDLSTGQRKRLALLQLHLEERPVAVFDEWAADQDPTFRRIFYEEILPALRAEGRTLIVISHDDRYFPLADRVLRLSEGRILPEGCAYG